MSTPVLIACIVAGVLIFLLSVLFLRPLKGLLKLFLHSVLGGAGLYILNTLLAFFNLSVGINIASATIAGILGFPGVIFIVLTKLLYP